MLHLINRLQFEVNCAEEEQAFHLRHNFTLTYQEQIVEAVDRICSTYVEANEWLIIDRLVIDLGQFTPASFEDNFARAFQNQFEKKFVEKIPDISPVEKKAALSVSRNELFQFFLQTGVVPWWASNIDVDADEIGTDLMLNQPGLLQSFLYEHRFLSTLWKRAALQLNNHLKAGIVELVPELHIAKEIIYEWLNKIVASLPGLAGTIQSIEESIVDTLVINQAPVIFKHPGDKRVFWSIMEDNSEAIAPGSGALLLTAFENNKALLSAKDLTDGDVKREPETENLEMSMMSVKDKALENKISAILPEKYFVTHAGIVLLSPFLQPFFRNLGLLHEGEWKDINAQYQGIHLLKYLSTAEQKAPEYKLLLEKLICGLPLEMPVPLDIVLPAETLTESDDLLESVIGHWKALKNTSVNGLREAFLKRDGLLIKKDEGWLLQVERKTLDVLIDSIPWGYSTLKFSWNAHPIFVEW